MAIDIIISTIFLILLGLAIIGGRYAKAGIGEIPLIYRSTIIRFVLNLSMLAVLAFSIFLLFFYSWKLFVLLLAIGFITEVFVIIPLIEKLLYSSLKVLKPKGKWRLEGWDVFDGGNYSIQGEYDTEEQAMEAANLRLLELEEDQPTETSGGQSDRGVQDRVYIVRPDGSKYRWRPH